MILRDYQSGAIDALLSWFEQSDGHPLIDAPTGSGKSAIIAGLCQRLLADWPSLRVLMLTHRKELIEQNAQRLLQVWPEAPLGIYSAGLGKRNLSAPILFAGIQSLNHKRDALPYFDLCIVDEAHLISTRQESMYGRVFATLEERNPNTKIVGLTATPFRGDWRPLYGKGRLFAGVAYKIGIPELLNRGYLAPLTSFGSRSAIDTRVLRISKGEFVESDMAKAYEPLENAILDEVLIRAEDRQHWLLFASTVEQCYRVSEKLAARGVSNAVVTGETSTDDRDSAIRKYQNSELRCIVNCNVLTVGFDAPQTDLLIYLRATQSPVLYVQSMGRGMRTAEGKIDCRVLDYGGNVARFGPVENISARERKPKTGDAPVKICPSCEAYLPTALRACSECGYLFPEPEPRLELDEGRAPMGAASALKVVDVHRVLYARHERKGSELPTLKVTYKCGLLQSYSEWVCIEHSGYASQRARTWWAKRTDEPMPATVDEAVEIAASGTLSEPTALTIRTGGKYPEIQICHLPERMEAAA